MGMNFCLHTYVHLVPAKVSRWLWIPWDWN